MRFEIETENGGGAVSISFLSSRVALSSDEILGHTELVITLFPVDRLHDPA